MPFDRLGGSWSEGEVGGGVELLAAPQTTDYAGGDQAGLGGSDLLGGERAHGGH